MQYRSQFSFWSNISTSTLDHFITFKENGSDWGRILHFCLMSCSFLFGQILCSCTHLLETVEMPCFNVMNATCSGEGERLWGLIININYHMKLPVGFHLWVSSIHRNHQLRENKSAVTWADDHMWSVCPCWPDFILWVKNCHAVFIAYPTALPKTMIPSWFAEVVTHVSFFSLFFNSDTFIINVILYK